MVSWTLGALVANLDGVNALDGAYVTIGTVVRLKLGETDWVDDGLSVGRAVS